MPEPAFKISAVPGATPTPLTVVALFPGIPLKEVTTPGGVARNVTRLMFPVGVFTAKADSPAAAVGTLILPMTFAVVVVVLKITAALLATLVNAKVGIPEAGVFANWSRLNSDSAALLMTEGSSPLLAAAFWITND